MKVTASRFRPLMLAGALLLPTLIGACTAYGPPPPPPPPGWAGEPWGVHVRRCLRRFPRYDPRTDLIYRPSGAFRCPL